MGADTKRGAGCDYPASWCLFPGCEKCRATHPGLGRLAAQGLTVVTKAEADELADLRGRVERATAALTQEGKIRRYRIDRALEALRGR